ncbi:hypothetical protein G6F56_012718 [Rhizopus delemar]|nr:hypothetical protein G6F56_012718 [Rhizopus delemar]
MKEEKRAVWNQVARLNSKAMRDQGKQNSLKFEGTIGTDGIGVSVIKQNFSTSCKQSGESSSKVKSKNMDEDEDEDQVKHVETLTRSQHAELQEKCVLIDPNRRDLLYCMKEDSTIDNKKTVQIYTEHQIQAYTAL